VVEKDGNSFLLEAKHSEIPKAGKLNFKKVAPLFPPTVQLLVACPANENTLITLKDFSLYNPLLYSAFKSI
jgi:hypothetical protein